MKVYIKSWKVLAGGRSASWRDKDGLDTFYGHKGTRQQKLMSHNLYLLSLTAGHHQSNQVISIEANQLLRHLKAKTTVTLPGNGTKVAQRSGHNTNTNTNKTKTEDRESDIVIIHILYILHLSVSK